MNGSKLINKAADLWTSNDEWEVFERKDKKIYISNLSKNGKVLSTRLSTVKESVLVKDDPGQIWRKGEPNDEGYFTLTSVTSQKFLTASQAKNKKLEIRSIIKG